MNPIADYHMHTPLCGHAIGEPIEYAKQAVSIGLEEIGFSCHAPMPHKIDPKITMNMNQLPQYHRMIEDVRESFDGKLRIKVAIEADFIPGHEARTRAIVNGYAYDYVIGSIHFIKDWGFDNPDERSKWDASDINKVYQNYFGLLRESAQSGFFNIMGHVDLVKKFGNRPTEDMTKEVEKTADVFKVSNVVVEINTSGLRKPVKEIYPALSHLKIYCAAGVPLTFGSDAHDPKDVGRDFAAAVDLAKAAGYKEYVLFKNRTIERSVKL